MREEKPQEERIRRQDEACRFMSVDAKSELSRMGIKTYEKRIR